jgi:hypothetical protein
MCGIVDKIIDKNIWSTMRSVTDTALKENDTNHDICV